MQIEVAAEGLEFPEGPIAMPDGSVLLVEIKGRRLSRVMPDGTKRMVAVTGGGPNGAALGPDGAVYIANNGGMAFFERDGLTYSANLLPPDNVGGYIQRVDLATGELVRLYDNCEGQPLIAPNDLVVDRAGGFWFTDYGRATATGRDFGALYYARTDGTHIVKARSGLISPNGVGLSPDESQVYVSDTILGRLWAFGIAAPGELAPRCGPAPGKVVATLQGFQQLDSMAVEADGKICVATLFNGGITIFDADGSSEHVAVPDMGTTNICFGGADMRDAWITGATTGRLFRCRWPRPGKILNFAV